MQKSRKTSYRRQLGSREKNRQAIRVEGALISDKLVITVSIAKSKIETSEVKAAQVIATWHQENDCAPGARKAVQITIAQKETAKTCTNQGTEWCIEATY